MDIETCLALIFKKAAQLTLTPEDLSLVAKLLTALMRDHRIGEITDTEASFQAFLDRIDNVQQEEMSRLLATENEWQAILMTLHDLLDALNSPTKAQMYYKKIPRCEHTIELQRFILMAVIITLKNAAHTDELSMYFYQSNIIPYYNKLVKADYQLGLKEYNVMERGAYYLLGYFGSPELDHESDDHPFENIGLTELRFAAKEGLLKQLSEALVAGAAVNERADDTKLSPLDLAASHGQIAIIKRLLLAPEIRLTPNTISNHSSLYWAIAYKQKEAAILLFNAGARLTLVDFNVQNRQRLIANATELQIIDHILPIMKIEPLAQTARQERSSCCQLFLSCFQWQRVPADPHEEVRSPLRRI